MIAAGCDCGRDVVDVGIFADLVAAVVVGDFHDVVVFVVLVSGRFLAAVAASGDLGDDPALIVVLVFLFVRRRIHLLRRHLARLVVMPDLRVSVAAFKGVFFEMAFVVPFEINGA